MIRIGFLQGFSLRGPTRLTSLLYVLFYNMGLMHENRARSRVLLAEFHESGYEGYFLRVLRKKNLNH